ncbi:MAG TPA: D-alanine--D-alanine ligase [Methylomirabilota bacterium]|jgi:D-alanine-D-alanine ligase|nr:D-alanine--D-alanine ligase [Methylomirabilota bacterium]
MSVWRDKRVGVLFGGISTERDISYMTGEAVCRALQAAGYAITPIEVDAAGAWISQVRNIDVAFLALHGKFGEDGAVQGLLELAGVPYTGSGILASALAMHKPMAKRVWETYALPTPRWQVIEKNGPWALKADLTYPIVIKPCAEGSSVGVSVVRSSEALHSGLAEAFRYDAQALVEAYIPGKEVTVGIVGDQALGAMEVVAKGEFHSYEVKYTAGREEFILPASLDPPVYERVLAVALAAHHALGCAGYSRVDTRVNERGEVFLLEVNTLPGLTSLSYLPRIAAHAGFSYSELVEAILQRAALHIQRGAA